MATANKTTTTMHLYPADYDIVKRLAVEQKLTIPEAAEVIIGMSYCIFKALRPHLSAIVKIMKK